MFHFFLLLKSLDDSPEDGASSSYPGEGGEAVQLLHEAEHLQADGRHDDEEAGCENHQAAQLFTWTEDLVDKVFQRRGNLYQTHHT